MTIGNVSDTARWVAVYRAMESARPDAIFRDRYAEGLAGEHGQKIIEEMKWGRRMAWAMIVRTAVMDEIIMERIKSSGIDTVLNLAAGLDARAWRLPLPASLRWFDVDLPAMSEYKSSHMADVKPACQYEAIPADLTNAEERDLLFRRIGGSSQTMLVITEGLLIYLDETEVTSLARAIHAMPAARWWLSDVASPLLLEFSRKTWGNELHKGNAPFKFGPADSAAFFAALGWKEVQFRGMMDEAKRLKREMEMNPIWKLFSLMMPKKRREMMKRMSGVVLLERT